MQARFFPFVILIAGLLLACAQKKLSPPPRRLQLHLPSHRPKATTTGPALVVQAKRTRCSSAWSARPASGNARPTASTCTAADTPRYEGRSNVELEGMHFGHVGKDTLATLLREAEKIEFFELEDKYDSNVTDLPSSIIRTWGQPGQARLCAGRYPSEVQKLFRTGGRACSSPCLGTRCRRRSRPTVQPTSYGVYTAAIAMAVQGRLPLSPLKRPDTP